MKREATLLVVHFYRLMKISKKAALAFWASIFALVSVLGCGAGEGDEASPLTFEASTERGVFGVKVEVVGGKLPLNAPFELLVSVHRGEGLGEPLEGRTLLVEGWMPGHGHGMLRQSEVDDLGDGRYRVRGMLFHMPGVWDLRIKVIETRIEGDYRVVEDDQVSFEVKL